MSKIEINLGEEKREKTDKLTFKIDATISEDGSVNSTACIDGVATINGVTIIVIQALRGALSKYNVDLEEVLAITRLIDVDKIIKIRDTNNRTPNKDKFESVIKKLKKVRESNDFDFYSKLMDFIDKEL